MISARKLVPALSLLTVALANPILVARQTCKPNFQGNPLTIFQEPVNTVFEWTPTGTPSPDHVVITYTSPDTAFAHGEFLVEFTGQSANTYHIKFVSFSPLMSHHLC